MALSLVHEIRAIGTPALLVEARAAVASALAAAAAEEAGLLRPLETLVIPELERVLGLSEDSTTEEATEAKELGIIEDVEAMEAELLVVATGLSILFSGRVSMVAAMVVGSSKVVSFEVIITFELEAVALLPVEAVVKPANVAFVAIVSVVAICKSSIVYFRPF